MKIGICAIDPGYGGGIAFSKGDNVFAVKMPRSNKELWDYFTYLRETYGPYLIFIERVQMWRSDTAGNDGKQFAIGKMMNNYNSLLAILEANDIPLVEVAPITWQIGLNLKFPDKDKQYRKNMYKRFAAKTFKTVKPTLMTADALCILRFGIERTTLSATWVKNNIKNPEALRAFKN